MPDPRPCRTPGLCRIPRRPGRRRCWLAPAGRRRPLRPWSDSCQQTCCQATLTTPLVVTRRLTQSWPPRSTRTTAAVSVVAEEGLAMNRSVGVQTSGDSVRLAQPSTGKESSNSHQWRPPSRGQIRVRHWAELIGHQRAQLTSAHGQFPMSIDRDLSRRVLWRVASDTPASRRRRQQRVADTTGREHSMGASGNDMGSRERDSEMRGTVLVADRGRCHAVRQSCPEGGRLTPTEWNIGRR
jgi:hypothetical protein